MGCVGKTDAPLHSPGFPCVPTRSSAPSLSMPTALMMDHQQNEDPNTAQRPAVSSGVDPGDVLLCDLGNKALLVEDLENALRLWTRPAVLIAGRNSLDRLPRFVPINRTILYLDLSWNRLTLLEGFAALPDLRELDLSHNGVQSMLGLISNTELRVLRISHNHIRRIEGLHQMKHLEEADLSHNRLRTKVDVRALSLNNSLRRLRIEGNAFCTAGVQYGSYQIAMQHLLPGMSLLDGKPPSMLSASVALLPPPPPMTNLAQHRAGHRGHQRGGDGHHLHHTFTRDGRVVYNVPGDISVARDWRSVRFVEGKSSLAPPAKQQSRCQSSPGLGDSCRVTTGGGGPVVSPGSYVEIFLALLSKGHPVPPPDNGGSLAIPAPRETRGVFNDGQMRRRDSSKTGHAAPAQANGHRRAPAGSEIGDGAGGVRGGPHEGRDAAQSIATSMLSYRGLSRAERAVARRLAWSQARQEGTVGVGTVQKRRASFRKTGGSVESGGRRGTGPASTDPARIPATRGVVGSSSMARGRSSARRTHGGVATEELKATVVQTTAPGRRSHRPPANVEEIDPKSSGGGGHSNGMMGRGGSASKLRTSRQAGLRSRARDGNAKPGAQRQINNARQTGASTHGRGNGAWQGMTGMTRGRGGRRTGGTDVANATASSDRSSGRANKQGKGTSSPNGGSGGTYRYKITLGQRRRAQRAAPIAAPWTPREDAKPWRAGRCDDRGPVDGEPLAGDKPGNTSGQYVALEEVTLNTKRVERGKKGIPLNGRGAADQYRQHGGGGVGFDDDATGSSSDDGMRYRDHLADDTSRRVRPFVSPLSPAGIVQRASSARFSNNSAPVAVSGVQCAESRSHGTGDESHPQRTNAVYDRAREGAGRRRLDSNAAEEDWQLKPFTPLATDSGQYTNDTNLPPEDEVTGEEGTTAMSAAQWRTDRPQNAVSYAMPSSANLRAREHHGDERAHLRRAYIPLPSERGYSSDACSREIGDGMDGSRGCRGGQIEETTLGQQQRREPKQRRWKNISAHAETDSPSRGTGTTAQHNNSVPRQQVAETGSDGSDPGSSWLDPRDAIAGGISEDEHEKRGLRLDREVAHRQHRAAEERGDAYDHIDDRQVVDHRTKASQVYGGNGVKETYVDEEDLPYEDGVGVLAESASEEGREIRLRGRHGGMGSTSAGMVGGMEVPDVHREQIRTGDDNAEMIGFETEVMDALASMVGHNTTAVQRDATPESSAGPVFG